MSFHLSAKPGEIAETVLLPGDPLRAKFIAETMLENAVCYNQIRNMFGFTGYYKGKRVSIQGTGMGMPSLAIYASELMTFYRARRVIRVGSCGALQPELQLRDLVLAQSASTDSSFNRVRFRGMDYASTANFHLLQQAHHIAQQKNIPVKVGGILSTDSFYGPDPEEWKLWAQYGILAVEMETAALYTLAAYHKVEALALLTVSDNLVTKAEETAEARQLAFTKMFEIALELAV